VTLEPAEPAAYATKAGSHTLDKEGFRLLLARQKELTVGFTVRWDDVRAETVGAAAGRPRWRAELYAPVTRSG